MLKFNPRHAPVLLALFISLFMSCLMSMVITYINMGPSPDFWVRWMRAFAMAFSIAFSAILIVAHGKTIGCPFNRRRPT